VAEQAEAYHLGLLGVRERLHALAIGRLGQLLQIFVVFQLLASQACAAREKIGRQFAHSGAKTPAERLQPYLGEEVVEVGLSARVARETAKTFV